MLQSTETPSNPSSLAPSQGGAVSNPITFPPVDKAAMRTHAQLIPASVMHTSGYPEAFLDILDTAMGKCRTEKTSMALVAIAIENMTMIISGYGHETAERALADLITEVSTLLGEKDAIGRLQKDQFGIIIKQTNREELGYLCERIHSVIQSFGSRSSIASLHVMATVAPVMLEDEFAHAAHMLDRAFIALREHHNVAIPGAAGSIAEFNRQEMGLANYLNRAIQEERLRLAFQPIIDSSTGAVAHYEALLRVVGDDGTISSAGALIPIAERMGLIHLIDRLVLKKVCKELLRAPELNLSFNVSNLTTGDNSWLNDFKKVLTEHPEIASRMVVEITETAAHRDLSKTAYFVATIQSMGAQVALDDFGSGYTSFRQLKTLSVDYVKIDGAFIRDLVDNADNRFFVKTLLDFTKGFGLKAVAEFVESGEVAKMLMELGVEYMQGYYFGRPVNNRVWLKEDE